MSPGRLRRPFLRSCGAGALGAGRTSKLLPLGEPGSPWSQKGLDTRPQG